MGKCTVGESDYLRMVDYFLILYLLYRLTRECFVIWFHCWDLVLDSHSLLCSCMWTTYPFAGPTDHVTDHIFSHSEHQSMYCGNTSIVRCPGQSQNCQGPIPMLTQHELALVHSPWSLTGCSLSTVDLPIARLYPKTIKLFSEHVLKILSLE